MPGKDGFQDLNELWRVVELVHEALRCAAKHEPEQGDTHAPRQGGAQVLGS